MGIAEGIMLFFQIGNAGAGPGGVIVEQKRAVPTWLVILAALALIAVLYFVFKKK